MIKSNKGFTTVDITIAIVGFSLFSIIIVSLIYINSMTNIKLRRGTLGIIYVTEAFEKIGIADYSEVIQDNMETFLPENMDAEIYNIDFTVDDVLTDDMENQEDILKKITATVNYKIGNKQYSLTMERMKSK